jgi:hypothetical protein
MNFLVTLSKALQNQIVAFPLFFPDELGQLVCQPLEDFEILLRREHFWCEIFFWGQCSFQGRFEKGLENL